MDNLTTSCPSWVAINGNGFSISLDDQTVSLSESLTGYEGGVFFQGDEAMEAIEEINRIYSTGSLSPEAAILEYAASF